MNWALAMAAAGSVSLVVAWVASRFATRLRFVDLPDEELKTHTAPIPPVGGIGVFVGLHVGLLVVDRFDAGLFAATTLLLVAGLIDDRVGLPPVSRLLLEVGAGAVLGAFSDVPGPLWVRVILAAGLVTVAANAVNLIDGIDGLSGSTAGVAAIGLALLSHYRDSPGTAAAAMLAGALVGFLVLNWRPARIFLGDGGAYVVGATLAFAMLASVPDGVAYTPAEGLPMLLLAIAMLGVIGMDLAVTLTRRRMAGRPLFEGDRSHVYDQLRDRGWSVPKVVLAATLLQVVLVSGVLLLDRTLDPWPAVVVTAAAAATLMAIAAATGFIRVDD
jgi:UDP-GlcNAc:undecaprenyl-phosphate GlcNAc-1-phosphate transferase